MFIEYDDFVPPMPKEMVEMYTPISYGNLYEPPIPAPIWQEDEAEPLPLWQQYSKEV